MTFRYDPAVTALLSGAPSQLDRALAAGNQLMSAEEVSQRIMRNYGGRTVSPRGGALSRYATMTGDLPLPRAQCLDTMGYACAWGKQPTEFEFMDPEISESQLRGVGQIETPDVKVLPWEIGKVVPAPPRPFWETAGPVIGGIAGLLGIALSWRALRGRGKASFF